MVLRNIWQHDIFVIWFVIFPQIKIWKIPQIKKCLFSTMAKRTTSVQCNPLGTEQYAFLLAIKSSANLTSVIFLLKLLHCQIYERVNGCAARNVMSGTTKYALMRTARGNSFVVVARIVPPNVRNCTYRGTFPTNCKEFPNF